MFFKSGVSRLHEQENHPSLSIAWLLLLIFLGSLVGSLVAAQIMSWTMGGMVLDLFSAASQADTQQIRVLQLAQGLLHCFVFVLPALLLGAVEKYRTSYIDWRLPSNPWLWGLTVLSIFFILPLMELSVKLNESLQLPAALSQMQIWMEQKQAEAEQTMNLFFSDTSYWGLLINLLVMAAIAAVGEELLFRGCLQNILTRWFSNVHVAIWVTAVIFSAVHLQFFGFLPRMLLGALFGYLLFWGKSIWFPILAHFVNNALVTVVAFVLARQGKSLNSLDYADQFPIAMYILSVIMMGLLLLQFRKAGSQIGG